MDEKTGSGRIMKQISVDAVVENISVVTDFVNEQLEQYDCPLKALTQIDIAIDELFGNIVHYAYHPGNGSATVRVEVTEGMEVIITFIDQGVPFDPLSSANPDINLSAEDRKIGGLGIYIVKKSMDEISYEYKNGSNILRIRKNL